MHMITRPETRTSGESAPAQASLDVARIREDFPALHQTVNGKPLVYLDNAATSQKPRAVIDAITHYYEFDNANIHRGVHSLSVRATEQYERARRTIQRHLNAARWEEIVFVRSATEAINLVAQTLGRGTFRKGDEILISTMEHHSNIVPWQLLASQIGCVVRVIPINDRGELILEEYGRLLGPQTKLVSIAHVSNSLGTINPLRQMIDMAHRQGALFLVDGAQAIPHMAVDVRELQCDFYTFSGHKAFGPTGIGALYGRFDLLQTLSPYQGGGEMIKSVSFEKTTYNEVPFRFEAGTPHIAGAIGLGVALDYLRSTGFSAIQSHELELLGHATDVLSAIPGVRLIGTAAHKAAVVSFIIDGVHAHDVGTILDQWGIAVRTGHHCTQPVMDRFGVPATSRASLALYNTHEEIDVLADGVRHIRKVFG